MKTKALAVGGLWLAAVLCVVTLSHGEDWPRFRGYGGAGASIANTVPRQFTAADYNWRVELPGPGHSSPVIFGDRIFLTSIDRDNGERVIYCLAVQDGSELWRVSHAFRRVDQHRSNSFAASTPAVDADHVYVIRTDGVEREVVALRHDSIEAWSKPLGPFIAQHGAGASPIVVGGVVIVTHENEDADSFIVGLDASHGGELWKLPRDTARAAYSTPCIYNNEWGQTEVILTSSAHGITSINPLDGSINWQTEETFAQRCAGSPVVANGIIVATAGSGGGGKEAMAIIPGSSTADGKPRIAYDLGRRALPYVPTPIAWEDKLFLWADGGIVTCLRAKDGEQLWQERIGGHTFSSPICVNGSIYSMSSAGTLTVIDATDQYRLIAQMDLGEATQATPAVAGGKLYLRTRTHLISVGGL